MSTAAEPVEENVEGIPVVCVPPTARPRGLALWLTHLGGSMQRARPMLDKLAAAGFLAVSFDPPQHGRRSTGDPWAFAQEVLSSFRRRMWPLLGLTVLESVRVLDWTTERYGALPIVAGGISMGGDVSIALAGIDQRVQRVCALAATPDWTRPHMHRLDDPQRMIDQGQADRYAQWFYDHLDPMTHAGRYRRSVALRFHSGAADRHVPIDDAIAFRDSVSAIAPDAADRIEVVTEEGASHLDIDDRFYGAAVGWLSSSLSRSPSHRSG